VVGSARMAGRIDFDTRGLNAQMFGDAAPIERVPKVIVEGSDGSMTTKPSSMPDWLREQFKEGEDFNGRQRSKYPHNEVYVENYCAGGACLRLDSYDPKAGVGEIISRKYIQLADIKTETAVNYMRELERKYAPGTLIADVPSNRASGLAGQKLRGQMYLEVPTQNAPVPQALIDEARRRDIRIREENGYEF